MKKIIAATFVAACFFASQAFADGVNDGGNRQGGVNHDRDVSGFSRDVDRGTGREVESPDSANESDREVCSY